MTLKISFQNTFLAFLLLLFCGVVFGQTQVFPGEDHIQTVHVRSGNYGPETSSETGGFSSNFNRARGIVSVGIEVQNDHTNTSWDQFEIYFYYNGTWKHILSTINQHRNSDATTSNPSKNEADIGRNDSTEANPNIGIDPSKGEYYWTGDSSYRIVHTGFADSWTPRENNIYLKDRGTLERYNFSYNPLSNTIRQRKTANDDNTFGIQFDDYTDNSKYPEFNADNPAEKITTGYGKQNHKSGGNKSGIYYLQHDPDRGVMIFNISNLPPEMISANSFKVRIYAKSDASTQTVKKNVICVTTYNNPNPLSNAPIGLTASSNLCGKVKLTWSNSSNTLPTEATMYPKNVIFRDGTYLATVEANATSYEDLTAQQDVEYEYTVRHIAFSQLGKTYYQSNPSNVASGQLKPRPAVPVSPSATNDNCTGTVEVTWQYNETSPNNFIISRSTSSTGTYSNLDTVAGTERLFVDNNATRGQTYYYRITSVSDCGVHSGGAASISGISPSDPAAATNLVDSLVPTGDTVLLSWLDNANNETKYQIVRQDNEGNTVYFDADVNTTTFEDNTLIACRSYTYKVKVFNSCVQNGILSVGAQTDTIPPPNLNTTFSGNKKLEASKGYFSKRVELSWTNNNGLNIDLFKIYRKQLGNNADSTLIATANAGSELYLDQTADAKVLYKYTIVGVKNCSGKQLLTNTSEAIGFRNPTGIVSGHIEYEGAVAVEGAKVLVEPSNGTQGKSLSFVAGDSAVCEGNTSIIAGQDLRVEFWFKTNSYNDQIFVSQKNTFWFEHSFSNFHFRIKTISGTYAASINENDVSLGNWHHISGQYDKTTGELKMFLDGQLKAVHTVGASQLVNSPFPLVIGGQGSFLIDEFRVFTTATPDSLIQRDHSRYINQDKEGTLISLRMDEAYGNYVYDGSSQNSVYNKNHFSLTSGVSFSSDRPSTSQLGYAGITDSAGNYLVSGIVYVGTGDNYTLTPSYLTHSFSPSTKTLFIGENGNVFNNQDFKDESSFKVTGSLVYDGTNCPVEGATVLIDGSSVLRDGNLVKTEPDGTFEINVPIGLHFVSVEKVKHDMKAGRFPSTGKYNFQAPVSNIAFTDSTKRTIVGRVVGGLRETEKPAGMGRSKNNLGQAKIKIVSPISGPPCFEAEVLTDLNTGEYRFDVPPLEYRVESLYILTNENVLNKNFSPTTFTNANKTIDLRNKLTTTTEKDSVFNSTGTWSGVIDSSVFHIRRDFTHRQTPSIWVLDSLGRKFEGEDSLEFGNQTLSIRSTTTNPNGLLGWPVFKQGENYKMFVYGNEVYTNTDNNDKDTVPLSGNIKVTNGMVKGADPNSLVALENGVGVYSFSVGDPNTSTDATNADFNYTKIIQVSVEPSGAPSVTWQPNAASYPANPNYRGLVIGKKVSGTGVATQGPELVEYILRDPPGSESYAAYGAGTVSSKENTYSKNVGSSSETSLDILIGTKFATGIGLVTENDLENTGGLGFSHEHSSANENTLVSTTTNFTSFETRDDEDHVGANADVFIGKSRNWLVGPTINIELVDTNRCSGNIECFGEIINGKQLAKTIGYAMAPNGIRTRFAYTQKEIEETVIPTLESLRNSFLSSNSKYQSHLPSSSPYYGINNDDLLFPARHTNSYTVYDSIDRTGNSYTFTPDSADVDSVRLLNNQIAIWKRTLAQNERDKHLCLTNASGATLIDNFTLGSAIISQSYSVETESTITETYELAFSEAARTKLGLSIGGSGSQFESTISVNHGSSETESKTTGTSTTFDYVLADGNEGDIMSVDVYKSPSGYGNVFITRGGQTMCPYEDEVVFHYYNPTHPNGFIGSHSYNENGYGTIANATVKREEPNIQITPAQQFNVPSDQAAVYQLQLTNQSALTVNNDIELRVYVASESNPNGAIVKIDGLDPNTTYTIPTGASVVKTLTVERGPIEIEYDSLMIVFASTCSDDIADTAYISAHFIPSCTEITMAQPPQNWVFNNAISNQANLITNNYNYNYGAATDTSTNPPTKLGFNNIAFEFKPSNTSTWTNFQSFYKYPEAGQDTIPNGQVYTQYLWNIKDLPD